MHSALYYADIYIGDSQTMAAEAAVLGTASLRFNDFVGQISYLEELEHKYKLTVGIQTNEKAKLFTEINTLLSLQSIKNEWGNRKDNMLKETEDLTELVVKISENFKILFLEFCNFYN